MNKVEIFLPLPGMAGAMDEYFTSPNVTYLNGLPTGAELPADDLTEAELLDIGFEAAQEKVDEISRWDPTDYIVDRSVPFIAELHNRAGEHIGWEFEFDIFTA